MSVTTHGGTSDGTYNSSSTPDCDADAYAALTPLPDLWQRHVGGLSQLSHDHNTDRGAAPHSQNPALHHSSLSPVSAALSARGRRTAGTAQARVWPRCHRVGRHAAPCPAPQCARNSSGVGTSPACDCSSDGPPSPGAL